MKPTLLVFFCLVLTFNLSGQEAFAPFQHLTIMDGLLSNHSARVYKDKTGFVWIGSNAGLCRYDGYMMKHYKQDTSDVNSLNSDMIQGICEDSYGNLWIGTHKGLNKYDEKNDRFIRYSNGDPALNDNIVRMCADHDGNIWMGISTDEALIKYNDVKKLCVKYVYKENNPKGKGKGGMMCMNVDKNGIVWVATWASGLSRYNAVTDDFTHYLHDPKDSNSIFKDPVFSMASDGEDYLWVSSGFDGLARMDKKTGKFTHSSGKFENFPHNSFNATNDNDGNVWFCTFKDGLCRYDVKTHQFSWFKRRFDDPESLSEDILSSVYVDYSNVLWISTVNNGINKLDLNIKDVSLCKLPDLGKAENDAIYSFIEDREKNILIGCSSGLYKYFPKTDKIQPINIQGLRNVIVVSTYGDNILLKSDGKVLIVNMKSQKVSLLPPGIKGTVWQIFQKKNGALYMIMDQSLFYFASGNINNTPVKLYTFSRDGKSDFIFRCFHEDTDYDYLAICGEFIRVDHKDNGVTNLFASREDLKNLGLARNIYNDKDSIQIYFNINYVTYNKVSNSLGKLEKIPVPGKIEVIPNSFQYDPDHLCVSTYFGIFIGNIKSRFFSNPYICNPSKINPNIMIMASDGKFYIAAGNRFLIFDPAKLENKKPAAPKIVVTDLYLFNQPVKIREKDSPLKENISTAKVLELDHKHSVFSFELALLNFDGFGKNQYAYILEGFETKWNYIGPRKVVTYTNLPAGNYLLKYKAYDKDMNESNTGMLSIIINPPFWQTWWFRILATVLIMGSLYLIFKYRLRNIRRQKEELEAQVILRTKEINTQKNEIESQQEKITELYNDVTDSIQTAKFIQESILPPDDIIKQSLPESFVFYKPKDIVSGDFYWFHTHESKIYVAAVDCTGHGVAGAFMSLIAYNLLNRIIIETPGITPKEILDKLNLYVIDALNQESEHSISKDGMDISLCMIDNSTNQLYFSGANNPLYFIRNGQLEVHKADNNSVGIQKFGKVSHFTNQIFDILKGDLFYIFSDGIAGQFGGTFGEEKFKYTRFRETLLENHTKPFKTQKERLSQKLEEWKGSVSQTDDIMVIGFSV